MTTDPATDPGDSGPPRAVLIAAVALAVVAIGVVLAVAANQEGAPRPVSLPAIPAPHADDPACRALERALPQRLGAYRRAPLAQPAPHGAAAWRATPRGEPVVLRCGLDRPVGFVVGSPIQVVDGVQWFETAAGVQSGGSATADAAVFTWYTVDRPVYVGLTLPPDSGPTPIQEISDVIDRTVAAVPINPARPD